MEHTETPATLVELLFERVEAYGKTTLELSKLKAVEIAANVATSLISRLSVLMLVSLFVFVLSVGTALFLGELLGKSYYGFFIVAAFYLVAGVTAHFFLHHWIKKPVSKLIITNLLH